MHTKKNPYGLNPKLFFKRLTCNVSLGFLIILGSLTGVMLGYHLKHPDFALPGRKALLKSDMSYEVVLIDATETFILV